MTSAAEQEHENRQLGGYKATLHNPRTSLEAQTHAAEVLNEHGIEAKVSTHGHSHHHGHTHLKEHEHEHQHERADLAGKDSVEGESEHDHRVLGGYKATLHNPNVSQEAKEHAKEILKEHGAA